MTNNNLDLIYFLSFSLPPSPTLSLAVRYLWWFNSLWILYFEIIKLVFLETLTFRLWLMVECFKKRYGFCFCFCFFLLKSSINSGCNDQFPRENFFFPDTIFPLYSSDVHVVLALCWSSLIRYPILDGPWALSTISQSNTYLQYYPNI